MSSGTLFPVAQQFFDNNGAVLASGKVYTYAATTSTPKTTYTDQALTSSNTNPIILDSAGRASIWGQGAYKIEVKTASGATLYTQDNIALSGAVATVVGDFSVTAGDSSFADGSFTVDTSGYVPTVGAPYAVEWTDSNVWTNADTYGSSGFRINKTGLDNNQPALFITNNVKNTNSGNAPWLELKNAANTSTNPSVVSSSAMGGSIQMSSTMLEVGAIMSLTITNGGAGYVDGVYSTAYITKVTGNGMGAYVTATVVGGVVITATMGMIGPYVGPGGGSNYCIGDAVTIANTELGSAGANFVATVATVSPYNGKLKFGVVSGRTGSAGRHADGYAYLGMRRGALAADGVNSGFEANFRIHAMSLIGQGTVENQGNAILLEPAYDFGSPTTINVNSSHQSSEVNVTSTLTDGDAKVELTSGNDGNAQLLMNGGTGSANKIELYGTGAASTTYIRTSASATQGYQYASFSVAKSGTDPTGLANDATVYAATVTVGGVPRAVAITGSTAQTYTTLIAQLDADTTGATSRLNGLHLVITSNTAGTTSTILIADTNLFSTLTDFTTLGTPRDGTGGGSAALFSQSDAKDSKIEVRSNWVAAGTYSSTLNLYTDNTASLPSGFRINANGSTGYLNIRKITNNVLAEMVDMDDDGTGRVTFYDTTAVKKGKIRLSGGSGTKGGGEISYNSDTGIYALTGTNATMTVNGLNLARKVASVPTATGDPGQAGDYFVSATFLYFWVTGTGWVRSAAATF